MQADGVFYFETEMPGDESVVGWGAVRSLPATGHHSAVRQDSSDFCMHLMGTAVSKRRNTACHCCSSFMILYGCTYAPPSLEVSSKRSGRYLTCGTWASAGHRFKPRLFEI